MTETSQAIGKEPCPSCGSKDNLARYDDGHAHCFGIGCTYREPATGEAKPTHTRTKGWESLGGEYVPIVSRGLVEATCRKYSYRFLEHKGNFLHIADYRNREGTLVGQKIRGTNKNFHSRGDISTTLFGAHLYGTGRKLVITEGEIDAMSVSQVQNLKWPVMSIPNGAGGAAKAIAANVDWLSRDFEEVIFMFDADEPGQIAAKQCAALLPPGQAKIASLTAKDPNELLLRGEGSKIVQSMWSAVTFRPEGLRNPKDMWEEINTPIMRGVDYPWAGVTEATFGIRLGEICTLGAGTGLGKSEIFKEIAYHLVMEGQKVGMFMLEESNKDTTLALMSKYLDLPIHLPGIGDSVSEGAKLKAFEALYGGNRVTLYDHFGGADYKVIRSAIRHMAVAGHVKYVFLDHITALVTGDPKSDERRELDYIMTDLAGLCRELNISIFLISHLATPTGAPHEEGGRVELRHLRGSRAIAQWSSFVFALERDQQAEGDARHMSTFRILKDRYSGRGTGRTFSFRYDQDTGRLTEQSLLEPIEGESDGFV